MSAIFGALHHDGRSILPSDLARMAAQLTPRKVRDPAYWHAGSVGVGHLASQVYGVSSEVQHHASGKVITLAGRIDNRKDLEARLGARPAGELSDGEMILAAYERYGQDCVDYLAGTFAFAIWDPQASTLFCARDQFGIRPFYYYDAAESFLFGSEIHPILGWPFVPRSLDERRVAELITESFENEEITIYKNVRRLPPGHSMFVRNGTVRTRRYWRPELVPEVRYRSQEEYAEAFRSLFLEAVRCRMDPQRTTGVTLSGGLDSSAVACAARDLRRQEEGVTTFSAVYPEFPPCDERPYIQAVIEQGGVESHSVRPSLHNPLAEREAEEFKLAEPHFWPTWCMEGPLFRAARERDIRVLLTGHGGDHVLAKSTTGYYPDLIRTGRWTTAFREARQGAQDYDIGMWAYLWSDFVRPFLVGSLPDAVLRARRRRKNISTPRLDRLNPSFARRIGFAEHWERVEADSRRHERTARSYHAHLLSHPQTHYGLDLLDAISARFSFRLSHPFWDRRLVEFCYGIPRDQLIREGRTSVLLRTALSGLLPEMVRHRNTKAYFDPVVIHTFRERNRACLRDLMGELDSVSAWISTQALQSAYHRMFEQDHAVSYGAGEANPSRDAGFLIATATLMLWMKRTSPAR